VQAVLVEPVVLVEPAGLGALVVLAAWEASVAVGSRVEELEPSLDVMSP
jgi:hypothetical protein